MTALTALAPATAAFAPPAALAPAAAKARPLSAVAFVEQQSQHRPALVAFVNRMVRDPMLAEDVVQEVMLRCWQRAEELDENQGPVRGWLFRVAHNIAIDRIRTRRNRGHEVVGPADVVAIAPDHAEAVVTSVRVRQALMRLSPAHRSVLYECYFAGRSTAEAAEVLGIPAGTVKSRLYYGMQTLRRLLTEPAGTPAA